MRSLTSLALLGVVVGCSPAAPPVVEAPKPPPPVTPKPAEPTHASWSFSGATGVVLSQINLGERGTLQVGERGRRWWFGKGDLEPKQATTLVPEDLVDGRAEGDKVLLVGEHGTVYLAKDALGPIETTRPGPKGVKTIAFRTGKQAILGVEKNGTLHRSTDAGASWSSSKLPLRAGDVVAAMTANVRGEVLVLTWPQRVLLSTDDGASFQPIATPGIGARELSRDGKDDLILEGAAKERAARLVSGKLEIGAPTPWVATKSDDKHPSRRELAGDRVVTVIETPEAKPSKKVKVEVAIAPLGKEATGTSVLATSVPRWTTRVITAGWENVVVAAVHDETADPPSTKLQRTNDDGKTWEQLGTLPGRLGYEFRVWAGPSHVLVSEVCDDETNTCKPAQLKVGGKPFKDVVLPPKTRVVAAQLDPTHDRAWLVGSVGDNVTLFSGKLSDGTFAPTTVALPKTFVQSTSIDAKGTLRIAYTRPTQILRVGPDGVAQPPLYAPFDAEYVALAGQHGYSYAGESGYETADGGEKWTKVPMGATGPIECVEAGCLQGGAARLGWDLPDPKKELVASTTEPPKETPEHDDEPPPPTPTKEPPLKLACTTSGTWKTVDGNAYQLKSGLDGDVRFLAPVTANDGSSAVLVARGTAAPTRIALLAPSPKHKPEERIRERSWTERTDEGFVAVRYSFEMGKESKDSKYAPVDVELAWYSAASGKTTKTKLAKVSPFRVGRAGPSALHAIVDGGLLFLPNSGDAPLSFIKEGGKVETMPRPPQPEEGAWADALKRGNDIVLVRQRAGDVSFALTRDAGKTWSTTTWSLGAPVSVRLLDGKITLGMRSSQFSGGPPVALFSFESLSNDPPDPLRLDASKLALGPSLVACTPKTRLGVPAELSRSKERRGLEASVEVDKAPITLKLSRLEDRIDASGTACNDAIELEQAGGGQMAAVVTPHDLAHGWLIRATKEPWLKIDVRPLSCK